MEFGFFNWLNSSRLGCELHNQNILSSKVTEQQQEKSKGIVSHGALLNFFVLLQCLEIQKCSLKYTGTH